MGEFRGTRRFELVRQLGAGGMGIVYEARDKERDEWVALKTLRHLDADGIYRFKREFRALQDLEHPNLVRFGELHQHDGDWFFTMELVDGADFIEYVRPGGGPSEHVTSTRPGQQPDGHTRAATVSGAFDERRLRYALGQLVGAVRALHAAGKIHRDLKPENIRVRPDGRVVLLDFGLALDDARTASSRAGVAGTAAYMAPEQAADGDVGPAADWYAVGVILYQALTGRLPFTGTALQMLMAKQQEPPTSPRERVIGLPGELVDLCMRLLDHDPGARPDGDELVRRLAAETPELALGSVGSME